MKRFLPIMFSFVFVLSACGAGKATEIVLPTAAATAAPVNATMAPETGKVGSVRTSTVDGMPQVFVPGATYDMGGSEQMAQTDERPVHSVTVSPFWIDKLEVTNGMYQLCVQSGKCKAPREDKSATHANYFTSKDFADFPVILVSWQDASSYCSWAGRRLPTEAEWELAARGAGAPRLFPWGDQAPDATLANFDFAAKDTVRVGSSPNGASPFGALDMAGNVWEWVNDYYSPDYYNQSNGLTDPTGPKGTDGGSKVIRGGSWADGTKELRVDNRGSAKSPKLSSDSRTEAFKGEANNRIGFRCGADGK
jgi:formylglycine-generating enzyme required for sulfatase activity